MLQETTSCSADPVMVSLGEVGQRTSGSLRRREVGFYIILWLKNLKWHSTANRMNLDILAALIRSATNQVQFIFLAL